MISYQLSMYKTLLKYHSSRSCVEKTRWQNVPFVKIKFRSSGVTYLHIQNNTEYGDNILNNEHRKNFFGKENNSTKYFKN